MGFYGLILPHMYVLSNLILIWVDLKQHGFLYKYSIMNLNLWHWTVITVYLVICIIFDFMVVPMWFG
jgi:hypothetical protein